MSLAARLKQHARSLGFDLIGITDAAPPQTLEHFQAWLAAGHAAEMAYLHRHTEVRAQPNLLLENARSLVFTVLNYGRADPRPSGMGRVASYAQRADYHRVMWDMLDELGSWLRAQVPGCRTRSVVDSAPLLERDLARRAGLGWFGKNTMLLHPELGSMFFIGCLLTTAELPADPPFATDHCGTCTACLDACPTAAFPEPGVLDAGRCISYLTIELKGPVPTALRPIMGDWVFGCDVCQDVCPWNSKAPEAVVPELTPRPDLSTPDLVAWLALDKEQYRAQFRDTPLTRPKRRGLLRNVCLVLGNRGDARAVPALIVMLDDEEPLVRGAAAWALGRLRSPESLGALVRRAEVETDETVRVELAAAVAG